MTARERRDAARAWTIFGARALGPEGVVERPLHFDDGSISASAAPEATPFDAGGLLALPGIVDLHGDAFERIVMPRPGVRFPMEAALRETDRQLIANGITTAFLALTISWEPGLRGRDGARRLVDAWRAERARMAVDARLHLRWETFAHDAVDDVERWLALEPRPILAFNDHTTGDVRRIGEPQRFAPYAARAGLSVEAYLDLLAEVWERRDQVDLQVERLASAARVQGATMLAHDERSPNERERFRALGVRTAEFPITAETADAARAHGEHAILGAPNVVRGGSHTGALDATAAILADRCTVLASDYYYPAPFLAAFALMREHGLPLEKAWPLVSTNAADAAGLADRGVLAPGKRADVLLVDDADPTAPRLRAVFVAGRKALETL